MRSDRMGLFMVAAVVADIYFAMNRACVRGLFDFCLLNYIYIIQIVYVTLCRNLIPGIC